METKLDRAVVLGQLIYGNGALWLNAQRIKAFHKHYMYHLRIIAGVPHPYYSRVSNSAVQRQLAMPSFAGIVRAEQFRYAGHLARLSPHVW